jgi:hypothetical protein
MYLYARILCGVATSKELGKALSLKKVEGVEHELSGRGAGRCGVGMLGADDGVGNADQPLDFRSVSTECMGQGSLDIPSHLWVLHKQLPGNGCDAPGIAREDNALDGPENELSDAWVVVAEFRSHRCESFVIADLCAAFASSRSHLAHVCTVVV